MKCGSCSSPWGHSKGVLAWNDAGEGFVMQVSTPSWPASGSERGQMAGYRGGISADLAHERCHMRLFSRLPGGQPGLHREPTARSSNGFRSLTRNYRKL